MEKTKNAIIMSSNFINALLPKFLKHLFYNTLFFGVLYLIYLLIDKFANINRNLEFILGFIVLTILFSIFKIHKELTDVLSTTYTFYSNHLEVEHKLLNEDTHSINYSQITDIQISKTFWDRICNVGDIIIHTANDTYENEKAKPLILKDMKNPDKIEDELTKKIHAYPKN